MGIPVVAEQVTGYTDLDTERMFAEKHSGRRSDFARDRARILHSGAFRRLAAKTQVLSPETDFDMVRNRLTHSLEVAQVGRELGAHLGVDPDLVDAACLAHDLGHPPYGHNGERALNEWAEDVGGFEGNAQSLRILTRLEPKVFDPFGHSFGLNLTRASLDASCKYPWPALTEVSATSGRGKFGFYADDAPAFAWLRAESPEGAVCIEAQVMDLSDDIAYSVHDFEDAVITGHLDPSSLAGRENRNELIECTAQWIGGALDNSVLFAALDRLTSLPGWLGAWDGSRSDQARLKNVTSQLIGRFIGAAIRATQEAYPRRALRRFSANIIVPLETHAEIAILKGVVAAKVMSSVERQPFYARQRELLGELANALWDDPTGLDAGFAADFTAAVDDAARKRVIVDQVASLTDAAAKTRHNALALRRTRR